MTQLAVAMPEARGSRVHKVDRRVAAAALAVLLATGTALALSRPRLDNDLTLRADGVAFSERDLDSAAGTIDVTLTNSDAVWHTFTIASLDIDLHVPAGDSRSIRFAASKGTYTFVCTIPGHERSGMTGTLTVH